MSEDTTTPGTAASPAPGTPSVDVDALIQERVAGFQRLLNEANDRARDAARELNELKTASLSEEEREQLFQSEKDRRIAELEAKIELRDLAKEYPTEVGFFEQLLAADSAKSQLEVMKAYSSSFQPKAPVEEAIAAAAPVSSPEIDLNRAMRQQFEGITLSDGTLMNDQIADAILGNVRGPQAGITQPKS